MTPPSELAAVAQATLRELDELISSETVRTRHIALVRTRGQVAALAQALTPVSESDTARASQS